MQLRKATSANKATLRLLHVLSKNVSVCGYGLKSPLRQLYLDIWGHKKQKRVKYWSLLVSTLQIWMRQIPSECSGYSLPLSQVKNLWVYMMF